MNWKVISKDKRTGELEIDFKLVSLLIVILGFLFGFGITLSEKFVYLIGKICDSSQIFVSKDTFSILFIVLIVFLILALAKYTIFEKKEK
jgi:formate hydrogenlyase subunit 3/multisubunit Na+/H+ antiporter MnhD subunit